MQSHCLTFRYIWLRLKLIKPRSHRQGNGYRLLIYTTEGIDSQWDLMAGNNAKKIGSEIEIFDKLESWNWLGIVWGYEINSKIYEDNGRGRKKTKSTGHHIAHSTSKLHCANTKKLRLLHKFYERAKGGVFHSQNCIEIVCSRWRLPSEKIEKVFGKLKRKLKIITLKQIINYQNQNSEKNS